MSTSTSLKPIRVWGAAGPNPPKVILICEELGLPYTTVPIPLSEVKKPEYVALNPNGRVPAIEDPNSGTLLWESGAILEYLVSTYDKEKKISFAPDTAEFWQAKQWLFFQVSGQGPYYGQAAWFLRYHPESVPSAVERYIKEVHRVTGVLESWLEKQKEKFAGQGGDGPWLVGNKKSYADLSFVMYQMVIQWVCSKDDFNMEKYPLVSEWLAKMSEDEKAKGVLERAKPGNQPAWEGFAKYP